MRYIDNDLSGKNILITGGAGFLGSTLALHLQRQHIGAKVTILDKFRDGNHYAGGNPTSLGHFKNLLDFNGEIISLDINDFDALKSLSSGTSFDVVFHFAAISDTTVLNQLEVMNANYSSFKIIIELCKKWNAKLIYASSAGTYGNTEAPNIVGQGEIPENVYGFSKLQMDKLLRREFEELKELGVIGLRYFNVYGAGESHKAKAASMIYQWGINASANSPISAFKMGEQKRDFVYIEDVIACNMCALGALLRDSSTASGIYNAGSGTARSYNDILKALTTHLGNFKIKYIDNPYKFFQLHTEADILPTMKKLGYKPRFSLEEGIAAYMPTILRERALRGEIATSDFDPSEVVDSKCL